jgi:hypothetical protein
VPRLRFLKSRLGAFLIGFLFTTLAGMALRASPVMAQEIKAQESWSDLSITRPRPAVEPPARLRSTLADQFPDARATQSPGVAADASGPASAVLTLPGQKSAQPMEKAQQDGETEQGVGVDLAVDGHMEVTEAEAPPDGREPYSGDPRLPQDRAAFASPPAGYDALAFQIALDPTTDARPRRLTALEPYAAVGRRAGSWVIFPTLETSIGGTSDVFRTSVAKSDLSFDVRPTLLAVTDWQRHALQFKATGLGSMYANYPSENERSYAFEARGRLDITKHANIEMLAAHSVDQEPRSSLFAPTDAKAPTPYATDKVAVAYTHTFNRLSLQLRGAATDVSYQPVGTYDGGTLSNAERDLTTHALALRAAWNFNPGLALFAESALNTQHYRTAPSDGITRDSSGDRLKLGVSFGTQSKIWRGEIAAGYGHQVARDTRLPNVEGLIVEANLGWKPTGLTSVLLRASTDFLTSTQPGQSGAVQRLGGIEVRHALQRKLIGVAGVSYQVADYQGVSLTERTTTSELGFEYFLSQSTTVLGRYQHVAIASSGTGGDSTTDSFRLGVRYRP